MKEDNFITMYDISSQDLNYFHFILSKYFKDSLGYSYLKKDLDKIICYKIRKYEEDGCYD